MVRIFLYSLIVASSIVAAKPRLEKGTNHRRDLSPINESEPIWQTALSQLPRDGKWKLQMNAFAINGQYDLHRYTASDRVCYEKSLNSDGKPQFMVHRMQGHQRPESVGILSCCFETDDAKRVKITDEKKYVTTKRGDLAVEMKSFTLEPSVATNAEGKDYTYFKVLGGDPDLFNAFYCTKVNENGQLREAKLLDLYGLLMSNDGNRGIFELKPDAL